MVESILIKNGRFVICNPHKIIEHGSVYIEGDKITDIGPSSDLDKYNAEVVIDASKKIVMPGLVDSHNHLCEAHQYVVFGMETEPLDDVDDYLARVIWPPWVWLSEESTYHMMMHGFLNSLKHGTTTVNDASLFPDVMGKTAVKSGLRSILAPTIVTSLKLPDIDSPKDYIKYAEDGIKNWHGAENGRITFQVQPTQPYSMYTDIFTELIALAKKYNVMLSSHVAESPEEVEKCNKIWPQGYMNHLIELDLMGPNTLFYHSVALSDEDITMYAKTGTKAAHCPITNAHVGNCARVPEMLRADVTVGLGTDSPHCDMFNVMRLVGVIHNIKPRPKEYLTAEQVFEMATIGGAKANQLEDQIGTLEVGKKADIITLDLANNTRLFPLTKEILIQFLVENGSGTDVDNVVVDGKILMENRKPKHLDEETILKNAQKVTDDLVEWYVDARKKGKDMIQWIHPEYTVDI